MVDCAVTESEAILDVFPEASVYYCHFHVAQIWERHMKSCCKVRETRLLLRQGVLTAFNAFLRSVNHRLRNRKKCDLC